MTIAQLMDVPTTQHDINWLKEALQAAIQLELSTIPPYLCGMWSIEAESGLVYGLIREVVFEEMLHLGLACNLLTTIGGTPELDTPKAVPRYPGPLPGGVRPSLTVRLEGLTRDLVRDVFMQIEFPRDGPIAFDLGQVFPTIGAFYDAVLDAFRALPGGAITGQRQRTNYIGLDPITNLAEAESAISLIKVQGEGTPESPLEQGGPKDLAHYYKFEQILKGFTLEQDAAGKWGWTQTVIPFPATYPMARVPPGGYPESHDFDVLYTKMLDLLQAAWANDSQDSLDNAVNEMYSLAQPRER